MTSTLKINSSWRIVLQLVCQLCNWYGRRLQSSCYVERLPFITCFEDICFSSQIKTLFPFKLAIALIALFLAVLFLRCASSFSRLFIGSAHATTSDIDHQLVSAREVCRDKCRSYGKTRYLTQSQYIGTGPTSLASYLIYPVVWLTVGAPL